MSNFTKLTIVFNLPNGVLRLVGDCARGPKQATLYSMVHLISNGQLTGVLLSAYAEHDREGSIVYPNIIGILEDYIDIFVEPIRLPPPCSHDHQIRIISVASLTNIQSYRYLYIQKSEIDRVVGS